MKPIQGETFTTVDNTNNIIRVMEIKEAVRRIREHNRIHYAKERNCPIITEILETCARLLEDIDAGKVKYVEYGEWKINCDGYYPYCSNCMSEPPGREMTDYCPVCGAKMKGDKMIEKHIYIAFDGKEFANRDACDIYEAMLYNKRIKEELAGLPNIKKAMSVISEYCTSHARCDECPMCICSPERCCYFRDKSPNSWLNM